MLSKSSSHWSQLEPQGSETFATEILHHWKPDSPWKQPKTKQKNKKKLAHNFQQTIQFLNFLIFVSRETVFLVLPSRSFK